MQSQDTATTPYYAMPDEAYWTPTVTTAPEIISSSPALDLAAIESAQDPFAAAPAFRGRFKKGYDPRRHKLTPDECSRGFWAAIESVIVRYPDAIMSDGRHMVCNFLKSRTPHTFEPNKKNRRAAAVAAPAITF